MTMAHAHPVATHAQSLSPAISRRALNLKPSVTVAVAQQARRLREAGKDVIGFTLGEPDFDTPSFIKQAAIRALEGGQTKYMPTLGDTPTRRVIAQKLTNDNGIPGLTPEHVAVSAGAKQALYVLMHCLFDHAAHGSQPQELLLPTPTWVSYEPIAELAGARTIHLPTSADRGFLLDPDELDGAITPDSRAIVLCTPSNPCGTMYPEEHLRRLARVIDHAARTRAPDLVVVVDEIYEKLTYAGVPHFSIGSIPEISERVITINGLSKSYAMTGWRAGYCACPGEFGLRLMDAFNALQGQISTNVTSFILPAIREAIEHGDESVRTMRAAFQSRARLMGERVGRIPGLRSITPQGAIYAFPDVSSHFGRKSPSGLEITSSLTFCKALLDEQLLAVIPGEDFGPPGVNYIRLSFACSEETINKGLDRLDAFVRSLR